MIFSTGVGAGKVWNRCLRAMRMLGAELRFLEPGSLRARAFGPDVWLFEGHLGPPTVHEPSVCLLHEAPWTDPVLRAMLSDVWVERLGPPSQASAEAATLILTPSESSARQIVASAGVDAWRVRPVPHGVDPLIFHPYRTAEGRRLVREAGGSDDPYVLLVSTVHPRKNVASLRRAMATVADDGLPHRLVLILSASPDETDGTSRDDPRLTEVPGHPGRTTVLRDLEEVQVAAVMSAAAAYCQPSLMEGFGIPVLEAMACGAPIVSSNRGSLPEVVGDAGVLVDPTEEELAGGLSSVLRRPEVAARLSSAGLTRSEQFTWEATAKGWLAVLREAAHLGSGVGAVEAARTRPR